MDISDCNNMVLIFITIYTDLNDKNILFSWPIEIYLAFWHFGPAASCLKVLTLY